MSNLAKKPNHQQNARSSIYMNPPLMRVQEKLENETFSQRLARIAERYELIHQHVNPLSEDEAMTLRDILEDIKVTPLVIKYLHEEILLISKEPASQGLAEKIRMMPVNERVACIEQIGR